MKVIVILLKIIGIIFLGILVLSIALNIFLPNKPERKYSNVIPMYSTTNLNIRGGSSVDHKVLKTVKINTMLLTSDSISNGFVMVLNEDSSKYGWTSKIYLQKNPVAVKTIPQQKNIEYSVYKEEVQDTQLKTQVRLDILINDIEISDISIRNLLNKLYTKTLKRSGFQFHDHPTNIFIYAYTTKEKAESGMGQWVGMVAKGYSDTKPDIRISEVQLKATTLQPEEKFGLSEEKRKEIWRAAILAQDKALEDADKKFVINASDPNFKQSNIEKNIDLNRELEKKYENDVEKKYNLSSGIIDSIIIEGVKKGWPFPK